MGINFIEDFVNSLKNDDSGFGQKKIAIAGVISSIIFGSITFIGNCLYRNLFDSTFILWLTTMIALLSSLLIARHSAKQKDKL